MANNNFEMCDSCRERWDKKGGLGQLCGGCVHNRDVIDRLESQLRKEKVRAT